MIATRPGTMPKRHRRSSPERTNTRRGTSALGLAEARSAGSAQALTAADVLEFLQRLSLDRDGFRTLDSGRRLLLEAVETGLVELRELDAFVGGMVELRRAGMVYWSCTPSDLQGDDLPRAAAFHLTERGRDSLAASRGLAARRSAPAYSSPIAGLLGQAR